METVSGLLGQMGPMLGPYAPRLLGALAIVAVAWAVARLVRAAVQRASAAAKVDERLHSAGIGVLLAGVASALVWMMALPALLGTLELHGLLTPVNALLSRLMGFVPNLIGAAVVLGVGLLVARLVRQIVAGLLRAAGSERAAEKLGLATSLGEQGLAGMAGTVVYVLVLLPTLVAALQPLGLDAVTQPLSQLLETIISLVPKLASAAIIVGVAALIGRALATLATALLAGMGLDKLPERLGSAPFKLAGRGLSELVGSAVMVSVVMVAITQACDLLGLPVLTTMVVSLGAALMRLAVAGVVLAMGLLLASMAARSIFAAGPPNAQLLAGAARVAILLFAIALALHQAGLPPEIITIAFASIIGAAALAVAVAVGVGGRHVAARALDKLAASFSLPGGAANEPPGRL
jgi:hypothetical protein